ncbi:MAG: PepSY domain-containing protein [Flammeovirgaceae bacterium]|nr:PepSY domain-containing protein [Flammeovirgaceae bacterium]
MRRNLHFLTRKTHRYLGIFIGFQFLGWTISGLFFSWNDLDNVHGDHLRKPVKFLPVDIEIVSPKIVLDNLQLNQKVDSIKSLQLIQILGKPYYQLGYFTFGNQGATLNYALANASTGAIRKPLTKVEAKKIALEMVVNPAEVEVVEYLTEAGSHHEYRERRLPAWAVTFHQPECTIYVSAEMGTFQTIRHNQWRAFDFLWMFHTMDYAGRDNFNNWLLKLFSLFGLFTILSGFMLFVISSKKIRFKLV